MTFTLGDPVPDKREVKQMAPPVVLRAQPDSFIPLESPEDLRAWENAVRQTTGVKIDAANLRGTACETCSAGCTDDCGMM
ncbi:hypothetical protein [Actinokineospora sp. UTMC 2448]|uniref:hypothetical protein n=1 Tax=Actinokineospora sp. UTMC 2448 TaxID=2268449 RepID=UPI0021643B73|nr:hypothetical protein [Actinokineospora sp. UTMC 2448]UVS81366.1 hypothetical protein Actkin_05123 [Actinokineospora sp. UTMC 2448]